MVKLVTGPLRSHPCSKLRRVKLQVHMKCTYGARLDAGLDLEVLCKKGGLDSRRGYYVRRVGPH